MHDFRGKEYLMMIIPDSRGPDDLEIKAPGAGAFTRVSRKGNSLTLSVSGDGKEWKAGAFTRVSRKGNSLTLSVSGDGKEWKAVLTNKRKIGESFRVGIYGFSNAKDDTTVYLDKFSIEPPKEVK